MNKLFSALLLVYGITFSAFAEQQYSYSVDYIQGEGDVKGIKLALQYHVDWLQHYSDLLELHFESSVNFWEYGADNKYDSNFVLAISPVIKYPVSKIYNNPLYVEFGIGFSLLDDTYFAGKNVGSHYQFEDRLGLVMKFGKDQRQSVGLRYFHYSNAGLQKPNPGLDFVALNYTQYF